MSARLCAVLAVLALAAVSWSQPQPPPGGGLTVGTGPLPGGGNEAGPAFGLPVRAEPPRGDAMMENFFPPELVMRHQKEIGLTPDQQSAIRAEMRQTVGKFADLQWQQSAEEEALQTLVQKDRPDEKEVLAQLDKLLAIENDLKRAQLGMLVRIKNILTPEQQAALTPLKRKMEPRIMPGQQGGRRGGMGNFQRGGPEGVAPGGEGG